MQAKKSLDKRSQVMTSCLPYTPSVNVLPLTFRTFLSVSWKNHSFMTVPSTRSLVKTIKKQCFIIHSELRSVTDADYLIFFIMFPVLIDRLIFSVFSIGITYFNNCAHNFLSSTLLLHLKWLYFLLLAFLVTYPADFC